MRCKYLFAHKYATVICKFKNIYIYIYFKILFPQSHDISETDQFWRPVHNKKQPTSWAPGGETLCVKPWWYFFWGGFSLVDDSETLGGEQKNASGGLLKKNIPGNRKKVQLQVFSCLFFVHDFLELFFCLTPPFS